jgi:cysteinyl-tRNA synthetase
MINRDVSSSTPLQLYNTLSRKKEIFTPISPPFVGLYVCGPTVYGDGHLGHGRSAVTFDLLYRYLLFLGYKVRYVRNITDVGHLENDADQGEDKIARKARLEKLEPMEVAQYYTFRYQENMRQLNNLSPGIEPRATGHIIEQIAMIEKIMANGFAYESNGSVYFDVLRYNNEKPYGLLSGRVIDDLMANTRALDGQEEKRNPLDFALWKKAQPEHIMRWPSPWSEGFPGWHIECSAMSSKYLGETFDIHGGGMDLMFPHHECEIAQSNACNRKEPVNLWMHNNMVTVNGKKMGKSLGNFITLNEFFSGNHPLLTQAFSPMTIRFFILQAHYRSTLDFSNEALKAAEKAFRKIINGLRNLSQISHQQEGNPDQELEQRVSAACKQAYDGMNDDLNSAVSLAALFDLLKVINSIRSGQLPSSALTEGTFNNMRQTYEVFVKDIFGLIEEKGKSVLLLDHLMETILDAYQEAKARKDYHLVDRIRAQVKREGILIKDAKNGIHWDYEE